MNKKHNQQKQGDKNRPVFLPQKKF